MKNQKDPLAITKPILISCIVLILLILVSCSSNDKKTEKVSNISINEKALVDKGPILPKDNVKKEKEVTYPKDEDLSNIKNTYYGKFVEGDNEVFGNFEVTRNSILFTPDNGNDKEIIHFNGMKNINRVDHPNGKVDLILEFDGYDKVIKNVSDYMFSDILLYTTK